MQENVLKIPNDALHFDEAFLEFKNIYVTVTDGQKENYNFRIMWNLDLGHTKVSDYFNINIKRKELGRRNETVHSF